MRALLVLAVLLLASPAWSQVWTRQPDGAGGTVAQLSRTKTPIFYDFTGTADPPIVQVDPECREACVWLDPDEDGANTGAQIQLHRCNDGGTFSTTICPAKILADTDGDGILNDVTLDGSTIGRIGICAIQASWIGVDVTANPGSDDARVMMECH